MERLSNYAASSLEVLPEFLQVEAFSKLSNAIGKVKSCVALKNLQIIDCNKYVKVAKERFGMVSFVFSVLLSLSGIATFYLLSNFLYWGIGLSSPQLISCMLV